MGAAVAASAHAHGAAGPVFPVVAARRLGQSWGFYSSTRGYGWNPAAPARAAGFRLRLFRLTHASAALPYAYYGGSCFSLAPGVDALHGGNSGRAWVLRSPLVIFWRAFFSTDVTRRLPRKPRRNLSTVRKNAGGLRQPIPSFKLLMRSRSGSGPRRLPVLALPLFRAVRRYPADWKHGIERMDNARIVVEDLESDADFSRTRPSNSEGGPRSAENGPDVAAGSGDQHIEIAMMRTPDGHSSQGASRFSHRLSSPQITGTPRSTPWATSRHVRRGRRLDVIGSQAACARGAQGSSSAKSASVV